MHKTITIVIAILSLSTLSFIMKNDGREGYTGSPGENTCNASGCHTGNPLNDASGSIVISAPTLTNWQYIPGTTYPIQVTVTRSANSKFGFGFEALQASGANGGTLTITNATQTQLKTAVVSGNARTNVVHKTNGGLSAGSHTFSFNWTAPASNIGNVTFYAAGNASNGFNNTAGDFIFSTSRVVTPTAVGISENAKFISAVSVYPNPVTDKFQIKFSTQKAVEIEVKLVNLMGTTVDVLKETKYAGGEHIIESAIGSDLKNGVYLIQMISGNEVFSKRIVVIR